MQDKVGKIGTILNIRFIPHQQRKSGWTGSMGFVRSAWLILHPTQWQGIQQTSSTVVHLYNEGRNWAPHARSISFNDVNSHRYLWLIESYPAEEGSQRSFQSAQFSPTYCRLLTFTLSGDVIMIHLAALLGMPHAFQVLTRSLQAMCLCQWHVDDLIVVSPIVNYQRDWYRWRSRATNPWLWKTNHLMLGNWNFRAEYLILLLA